MDRFKELSAFVTVASRGSLTAAADAEQVTPAVISRRLDSLESRLGVKLLIRTTRKLTLTREGEALLEQGQRILEDLGDLEATIASREDRASGHIRLSAPAGFGRKHVAPLVQTFIERYPGVSVSLDLSDRLVDIANEGFDLAIRIGEGAERNFQTTVLAHNRRAVVAAPAYFAKYGTPLTPEDLLSHECLRLAQQRYWSFQQPQTQEPLQIAVSGRFECNDGAVLRDLALAGHGICWRSRWEIGADVRAGRLVETLDSFARQPMRVMALTPVGRRNLPRLQLFVDYAREQWRSVTDW